MVQIFSSLPGQIIRADVKEANSGYLKVDGFDALPLVMTDLDVDFETAQTFTKSLGDALYVLPFGDNPTNITLSCKILLNDPTACDAQTSKSSENLRSVLQFYLDNRIKRTSVKTLKVTLGSTVINGFVTKFKLGGRSAMGDTNTPMLDCTLTILGWIAE